MTRYTAVFLYALIIISGCQDNVSTEAETMSALKLYVFDCGMLRFESIEDFSIADDETDIRDLIVPCYVGRGTRKWAAAVGWRIAVEDCRCRWLAGRRDVVPARPDL